MYKKRRKHRRDRYANLIFKCHEALLCWIMDSVTVEELESQRSWKYSTCVEKRIAWLQRVNVTLRDYNVSKMKFNVTLKCQQWCCDYFLYYITATKIPNNSGFTFYWLYVGLDYQRLLSFALLKITVKTYEFYFVTATNVRKGVVVNVTIC